MAASTKPMSTPFHISESSYSCLGANNKSPKRSSQSFIYDKINLQILEIIIAMSRIEIKINIHIKLLIYYFIR